MTTPHRRPARRRAHHRVTLPGSAAKANFRNETVIGKGGKQILLEDPAGNLVEPFAQ